MLSNTTPTSRRISYVFTKIFDIRHITVGRRYISGFYFYSCRWIGISRNSATSGRWTICRIESRRSLPTSRKSPSSYESPFISAFMPYRSTDTLPSIPCSTLAYPWRLAESTWDSILLFLIILKVSRITTQPRRLRQTTGRLLWYHWTVANNLRQYL